MPFLFDAAAEVSVKLTADKDYFSAEPTQFICKSKTAHDMASADMNRCICADNQILVYLPLSI